MRIRAIAAVGLAAAALLTVSACRVEQGAALFIGSERISEQRVDEIVDSIPDKQRNDLANLAQLTGGKIPNISTGILRGYIVDALTTIELGQRVAADTGRERDPSAAETAEANWESLGLDRDNEFVGLAAEAETYRAVLLEDAKPGKATREEIHRTADQLETISGQDLNKADKQALRASTAEQLDTEQGRVLVGQLRQVTKYIDRYDVTANPRYGESFIVISRYQGPQPTITAKIPS